MLQCILCEWEGAKKDLDEGRYCPCCGGEQFRKKERVIKNECKLAKTRTLKRKALGR